MAALNKIAYYQNRRDEIPNQELAQELAANEDIVGVREIAENLWHPNANVQSDCLKVLYEIGYLRPDLIAGYVDDFLKLLESKNNRLVWGSMIALSSIAELKSAAIFTQLEIVQNTIEQGSVITVDSGIKTLAIIAAQDPEYNAHIFPFLAAQLRSCRAKDLPRHAEHVFQAVDDSNQSEFTAILSSRLAELSKPQANRVTKILRQLEKSDG